MSTFLWILLSSYNTYLSSPPTQLFLIIFASINPIKIRLKPDCLPFLALLPNCFEKTHFHFPPSRYFFLFSIFFLPGFTMTYVIWSHLFCPWLLHHLHQCPELRGLCFSGPQLRQTKSHQTQVSTVGGWCPSAIICQMIHILWLSLCLADNYLLKRYTLFFMWASELFTSYMEKWKKQLGRLRISLRETLEIVNQL